MKLHSTLAIATAALAGLALTSCQAKEEAKPADPGQSAPAGDHRHRVRQRRASCRAPKVQPAPNTFVITNNGTKVTEFYVYGEGERVMGEVENISPGLQRKLIVQLGEAGTYQTACKPGMVGDGIRGDFKVTGDTVKIDDEGKFKEAADSYKRYVNSQTDALIAATQVFVDAVKKGDINAAKAQFPIARTYYERIEPVAESFPNDLDPRIDLREADLEPGQKWTGFHRAGEGSVGDRPAARHQRDGRPADGRRQGTRRRREGARRGPSTPPRSPVAHRVCSTRSRASKITGEEDIFSHTDLWDFKANVQGSQTAVASVRPILDERNADLGKKVDQRFADVEALLEKYRQGDGFVFYDKVTEPQRQELSRAIDALSQGGKPGARCHRPTVSPETACGTSRIRRASGLSRRKLFGAAGVTAAVVGAAGAGALAGRASAASTDLSDLHQPIAVPRRAPGRHHHRRSRTGCTSRRSTSRRMTVTTSSLC